MNKTRSKILEELSQNCRISTTQLAKKIQKPRHIVAYHKQKLVDTGTIRGSQLIINYEALGCTEYLVYLKLFQFSKIKKEVAEFLQAHPRVRWAASVFPNFSLRVSLIAHSSADLDTFMDDFEDKFGKHIIDREILTNKELIKSEAYTTKDIINERALTKVKLQNVDKILLRVLCKNPKASLVSLAKEADVSIETARQRIKKLHQARFIETFATKHEGTKVGHNFWCVLLFRLNNSRNNIEKLRTLVNSSLWFGKTRKSVGKWNFEMTVYGESYNDLLHTVDQLENLFGDDFEGYQLQVYTNRIIRTRIPEAVLRI